MLQYLQIENIATIYKAEIGFDRGLNILTGETGAGKSILIDSINAVSGAKIQNLFPGGSFGEIAQQDSIRSETESVRILNQT